MYSLQGFFYSSQMAIGFYSKAFPAIFIFNTGMYTPSENLLNYKLKYKPARLLHRSRNAATD